MTPATRAILNDRGVFRHGIEKPALGGGQGAGSGPLALSEQGRYTKIKVARAAQHVRHGIFLSRGFTPFGGCAYLRKTRSKRLRPGGHWDG